MDWFEVGFSTLIAGILYTALTGFLSRAPLLAQLRSGLIFMGIFAAFQLAAQLVSMRFGFAVTLGLSGIVLLLVFGGLVLLRLRKKTTELGE